MDAEQLFQEFLRLDHQIEEFYHELAVRLGLSDSAFQVLWSVAELGEGCTQRDICRQFFLSKQTAHSSVRKLEQEGVLTLRPGSGREVAIFLTEKGKALVGEKVVPAMEAERAAARGLQAAEWETALRLMRKWFGLFREAAEAIPGQG
ncbi:MAG: winged helix-turn-helix transcriptional regulator [Oscillibacter sp.]|nr:winged helix-turn-helix transcriptional regulator [Oscillibacter sp.]